MPKKKAKKKATKANTKYNERELCRDIATATLTTREMAAKHGISVSSIYAITQGVVKPHLKKEIDALLTAGVDEVKRIFKREAKGLSQRLISIAKNKDQDTNQLTESVARLELSYKATVKALEFAGLLVDPNAVLESGNMTFTINRVKSTTQVGI